ncbi:hypothetical protein PsorP6_004455 [Peronosclerospora sorghi]|uniref:Uncharacterized protein n=1 Tax=Peronosclerospora sorghi TaxID=230839 RepID=A0ACC0VKA4_9STRA|nr:hypothetical protein PsorP6_004455 [Peronosclerospora sorghi]
MLRKLIGTGRSTMTRANDVSDVTAISPSASGAPEPAAEPLVAGEGAQLSLKVRTLDQKTYPITIGAAASVPQLKELVALETGITLARQRLIYRGRVLKNDQTLASYSVEDGHVLHLVVRAASSSLPPQVEEGEQLVGSAPYHTIDIATPITGLRAASYQRSAWDLDTLTEIDALNTRLDEFHRSLRSRSRSRQRQRHTRSPPAPPRDNDEPDPMMAQSSSMPPGRVLMGATIATMPFFSSMVANLVTQVSGNGMRGEVEGATTGAPPSGHRTVAFSTDLPSRTSAAEMDVATARALRHHHRTRDGFGRQRSARRSATSAERQAALRARTESRLESVRATLNDMSLDFPAELTALSQGDTNTTMSELQQQVDMLLTLLERFGPRLRLLPAALAQRDRINEQAASSNTHTESFAASSAIESLLASPGANTTDPSPASPASARSNLAEDGSEVSSTESAAGNSFSARQIIRTVEVLQTIGETADLLARMARHAFVRQSVQSGEPITRRGDWTSTPAGDRIQSRFRSASRASNRARDGETVSDELEATLDPVQVTTRSAGTAAQGGTNIRPRIRVARISAANWVGERISVSPRATRASAVESSGLTPTFPIELTGATGDAVLSVLPAPAYSDPGTESTSTPVVALNNGNGPLPPASAHISIAGVGLPLVSSVVFPFSLAAGLGGSHATTTWNLADFVSRLTNELPISTIYGVMAGDATHLHHILAHVGFALFSGVDVPRVTRPNLRTWVQDFVEELRRLLRVHALPADVVNHVDGPESRRLAVGNELLRIVEPFIPDLVDFFVRATSASRTAVFGMRSATFLRSMAQQVVHDLRMYASGDALETERESDERLKRLLRGLLTWFGMKEHIARFVVDSLLCWTEGNNTSDQRRRRRRQREETRDDLSSADAPAAKRERQ